MTSERPTHSDIMVELAKVVGQLQVTNTRLNSLAERLERQAQYTGEFRADHEARIRDIEKGNWKRTGVSGVVAAAIAAVVSFIKFGT